MCSARETGDSTRQVGGLNKQIAADLRTCERTIKAHRAAIMSKLEVESVAELVRLAEELGSPTAQ